MKQSHKMDKQHADFMWFNSRVEATSTGTGLYIITWESKNSFATTSYAAEIFWVTLRTPPGALLS